MESCRRPTNKTNSNHVGECNAKERKKHLVLKKIWYAIANQKVSPILLQRIAYIPAENTSSLVKKAQRYVVLLMMCYRVSSHNSKQNFDFSPGINIWKSHGKIYFIPILRKNYGLLLFQISNWNIFSRAPAKTCWNVVFLM